MNKVLITKDALRPDSLPIYGNNYWETPNIDKLAASGTVFRKHYTAASSSAMSYTSMFSGLNCHELDRKSFREVDEFNQTKTLFDELEDAGYNCHVIWDKRWYENAYRYSRCYGKNTQFHNLEIEQTVGPHRIDKSRLFESENAIESINKVLREVDSIKDKKVFIWIHLPHVMHGRTAYGSDLDLLDSFVGAMRERFGDDSLYLSSDHGHMNCEKGIPVYGFHIYEGTIRVPFISPRISDLDEVEFPTSHTQLKDIILNNKLEERKYVYSDTAYYSQPNRKLAIIKGSYKYIFNKHGKEEFYDVGWDIHENINILKDKWVDSERHKLYYTDEISYYPFLDQARAVFAELRQEKERIWRTGGIFEEALMFLRMKYRNSQALIKNIMALRYKDIYRDW